MAGKTNRRDFPEKDERTIWWTSISSIHELDCVQHLLGEIPETVTMIGGNLAHSGLGFGNKDDMLFMTLEFPSGKLANL